MSDWFQTSILKVERAMLMKESRTGSGSQLGRTNTQVAAEPPMASAEALAVVISSIGTLVVGQLQVEKHNTVCGGRHDPLRDGLWSLDTLQIG